MEEENIDNCYALRDLVLKAMLQRLATLLFSRFLNCTNGIKSHKSSHLILVINDLK